MKKLLVIVGPTGVGKTALGIQLAKKFNGEIVSADSRQIFRGMDVGTGKSEFGVKSVEDRVEKGDGWWLIDGIKIHLYDVVDPDQRFSVAEYQQKAYKIIDQIAKAGKLPILVGGTGLYVQAVVEGLKIPKVAPDQGFRAELEKKSTERLLGMLKEADPVSFQKIDHNNRRRIIRALEVTRSLGEPFSAVKAKSKVAFETFMIGLNTDREKLYKRIDAKIDSWFESGLFQEEVKELLKKYSADLTSFTSLGYQDVTGYLEGRLTLLEAIQRTKFKHHSYVRAQLTWFRKLNNVFWYDSTDLDLVKIETNVNEWLKKNHLSL